MVFLTKNATNGRRLRFCDMMLCGGGLPIQAIAFQSTKKSRRVKHAIFSDVGTRVEWRAAVRAGDECVGGTGADDENTLMLALKGVAYLALEYGKPCLMHARGSDSAREKTKFERQNQLDGSLIIEFHGGKGMVCE